MRFLFLVIFIFGLQLLGVAQILNIEKNQLDKDTLDFTSLNVGVNFSLFNRSAASDEPVNLLGFNNKINFIHKRGNHALIFINQIDYLRINENPWLNTGFSHFRGHFWRPKKRSLEVYTQHSYDNFRRLNPRILVGTNMRVRLVRNKKITLNYGIGTMYEWERWEHPHDLENIDVQFIKINTYFTFRAAINDNLDYNGTLYYQVGYDPKINNFRNRVFHTSNIITKVTKRLSLNLSFEIQYEDRPIIPITPLIFSIRNGLIFSFD
ncbi:MAG: DUF481 domain-containing protein [Cryomorphaceae bacterium]|nr:DUF481 domain-containing protein [Cryomorphaceae bacterium]